jgi:hypothetical protein
MFVSPVGMGTKNHCAGESQQQFSRQADRQDRFMDNSTVKIQLFQIVCTKCSSQDIRMRQGSPRPCLKYKAAQEMAQEENKAHV